MEEGSAGRWDKAGWGKVAGLLTGVLVEDGLVPFKFKALKRERVVKGADETDCEAFSLALPGPEGS